MTQVSADYQVRRANKSCFGGGTVRGTSSLSSPSLPLPFEIVPLIAARGSGSALASPAGSGGARPPNAIW